MNRQTVLEILRLLSVKRKEARDKLESIPQHNQDEVQYWNGMLDSYFDLKQELKAFLKETPNTVGN